MIKGSDIMERAGILLADEEHVRWTLPELCLWINDGVRATILAKPSASSQTMEMALKVGTLQTLPLTGDPAPFALIRITRNLQAAGAPTRVGGRPVRMTEQALLDSSEPGWHDPTIVPYRKEVRQAVFDPELPLEFYCYPGNDGTGVLEIVVSTIPTALAAEGAEDAVASYEGPIGLSEPWAGAVLDFVLHRAHAKDDTPANAARSSAHFQQFAAAVGIKVQAERSSNPNAK